MLLNEWTKEVDKGARPKKEAVAFSPPPGLIYQFNVPEKLFLQLVGSIT